MYDIEKSNVLENIVEEENKSNPEQETPSNLETLKQRDDQSNQKLENIDGIMPDIEGNLAEINPGEIRDGAKQELGGIMSELGQKFRESKLAKVAVLAAAFMGPSSAFGMDAIEAIKDYNNGQEQAMPANKAVNSSNNTEMITRLGISVDKSLDFTNQNDSSVKYFTNRPEYGVPSDNGTERVGVINVD